MPALVVASLIFWGSSQAIPLPLARIVALSDKLFHAMAFATLAVAVVLALRVAHRTSPKRSAVIAGIIASLYGVSDEWHQFYVPGRFADPLDVAADVAGALVATVGAAWILSRQDVRRQRDVPEPHAR
ncbi:MAG: VanZ family protein [Deltaproteobacteria bacterium]|nr:VanZ family protein [Deltaproteobacteria bacterium]